MSEQYIIYQNKKKLGPFSFRKVKSLLKKKTFTLGTFAWKKGLKSWVRLGEMEEFSTRKPVSTPPITESEISSDTQSEGDQETDNKKWFLYVREKKEGPFTKEEIITALKQEKIRATTPAARKGMKFWKRLTDLEEFNEYFLSVSPRLSISQISLKPETGLFIKSITIFRSFFNIFSAGKNKRVVMIISGCLLIIFSTLAYKYKNFALYTLKCHMKNMDACYNLGLLKKDYGQIEEANKLFKSSCKAGEKGGCVSLGVFERDGGNKAKAIELFRKACDQGEFDACREMKRISGKE